MATLEIYKDTKKELDSISSSMCFAKWTQVTVHLGIGYTHSCHHPTKHKIHLDELAVSPSALHNTKYKKEMRSLMIEGKRPPECNYCWMIEDSNPENVYSDRIKKSSSDWSAPYKDQILKDPLADINPSYFEVSFNNTCNLKCSYCSPFSSSKWAEEIKQFGGYPVFDGFNDLDTSILIKQKDHNPYIEAFWKWWPTLYPSLKVFRITGGEPLLSKNTFQVMDKIIADPRSDLEFSINTNLSVPDDLIDKMIDRLQRMDVGRKIIYTSCEGFKERAEYSRFGMNYDKWFKNCEKVINNVPGCRLSIMSTYNVFSPSSYNDFVEDITRLRTSDKMMLIDASYLRHPYHLSMFILDDSFEHYFKAHVDLFEAKNLSTSEINNVKRLYSVFKNAKKNTEQVRAGRKDFVKYVDEYDRRRGTDFLDTFPELEQFYYKCMKPS
jgi:sulfatase maturation enzyme AslB (radical SAM superfamily)